MKKSQIIALLVSLLSFIIASIVLYRKKGSKLTYAIALAGGAVLFFAISAIAGPMVDADTDKKVDAKDADKIVDGDTGGGAISEEDMLKRTVPIDAVDPKTALYHPSKDAKGQSITGMPGGKMLVGPVRTTLN